jgi:L,D-transpeptidase YcbB
MRSLKLVVAILCSVLTLIIITSRRTIFASEFFPQQPVETLTPAGLSALHAIADSARNEELRWPDFAPYKAEFSKFYDANGSSLVWVQNGQIRPQALAVIEILKNANSRGLEPEDYDGPRWPARLLKLQQNPSERELVSFDTALTVSAMRYIRAVHVGRANPKEFQLSI